MVAPEIRAQEIRLHRSRAPDSSRSVSLAPPLRPSSSRPPGGGCASCPAAAGRPAPEIGPRGRDSRAGLRGPGAPAALPTPGGMRSWQPPAGARGWGPGSELGTQVGSCPSGAGGPGTTAWELAISALIPPPAGQMAAFLCACCRNRVSIAESYSCENQRRKPLSSVSGPRKINI